MTQEIIVRIGTRASALARWQADWVASALARAHVATQIVHISTIGDQQQSGPIESIGGQGVFVKQLQHALLQDEVDLAVHSMKDLPTVPVDGLIVTAIPPRAAVGDALITRDGLTLVQLPPGACVGTGSKRRRAQLLYARPDLQLADLRGNVDTRLRKLEQGQYDAIVLAEAGVRRLGLDEHITQVLPKDLVMPAPGQGALALETRSSDRTIRDAVSPLDDPPSHHAVLAERSMLAELEGGCLAPIGAWARWEKNSDGEQGGSGDFLTLTGVVVSPDGKVRLERSCRQSRGEDAVSLGQRVAEALLEDGAAGVLARP